MNSSDLVRLSTYVFFIDEDSEVHVHHTVRDSVHRISRETYEDLLMFRSFNHPTDAHALWIESGILVRPFLDLPEHHGGFRRGSEALLGRDYQSWYWLREVEAEREYRWLGQSIVKMPSDLAFYQEIITAHNLLTILEIGYGYGGGLWFFATIASLLGKGHIVGVDLERVRNIPPFGMLANVWVDLVHGNGHAAETVVAVRMLQPEGFRLVVIDADSQPEGKLALLNRWSALVAPGGYLILEDVTSPACQESRGLVETGIDKFLLEDRRFEIAVEAGRYPLLKARGAVLRRRI